MVWPAQIPNTNIQKNKQKQTNTKLNIPRQLSSIQKAFAFFGLATSRDDAADDAPLRVNSPIAFQANLVGRVVLRDAGIFPAPAIFGKSSR